MPCTRCAAHLMIGSTKPCHPRGVAAGRAQSARAVLALGRRQRRAAARRDIPFTGAGMAAAELTDCFRLPPVSPSYVPASVKLAACPAACALQSADRCTVQCTLGYHVHHAFPLLLGPYRTAWLSRQGTGAGAAELKQPLQCALNGHSNGHFRPSSNLSAPSHKTQPHRKPQHEVAQPRQGSPSRRASEMCPWLL